MTTTSKKTKTIYWIFTGLLSLGMLTSSIPGLLGAQQAITFITGLGYPAYMIPFFSVAKILGVIAILIPGYPRIKEWAYAGLTFDLVGATYSQMGKGTPIPQCMFMLIWFAILFGSYIYYHKKLNVA